MHKTSLSFALLLGLGATAQAQGSETFRLEKTEHGYVRLNTQTGAMSICEERDTQLVCRMAADEAAAGTDQADGLHARIDRLEARIATLERQQKSTDVAADEEFDKGLHRMERFLRGFMGIVREFESDPKSQPDRT
ncbi:hypothetical protein ACFOEZ_16535 [Tianweitania populi]|uniref:Uncharacterized protein n=1 Tax=Tianweitania populi TaxID=1607949 RepID=A0A8J3DQL9_9HYPH|nr:hypothetical protein [Tianweitania populi]GHD15235.1 hypothetical protein GCM10016234_21770 [Tianweitania populi]